MSISYREISQSLSRLTFAALFFACFKKNNVYISRSFIVSLLSVLIYLIPCLVFSQPTHPNIDLVVIEKAKRKMYLISNGQRYREFYISLGENPVGHKQQSGDDKTPEGRYTIDYRNPNSSYHLSLHITYPSEGDIENANRQGINPGGGIFIHGMPNGMEKKKAAFQYRDWTDGCIGVTNTEIKEIWELVENGTTIEIRP